MGYFSFESAYETKTWGVSKGHCVTAASVKLSKMYNFLKMLTGFNLSLTLLNCKIMPDLKQNSFHVFILSFSHLFNLISSWKKIS